MKVPVYIPTRARAELVTKNIAKWEGVGAERIILVVDPMERQMDQYYDIRDEEYSNIRIMKLKKHNQGLGYIRDAILRDALKHSYAAHIQADDDYHPTKGDVNSFGEVVLKEKVVGCGASYSYHGLTLGNEVIKLNDVDFPSPAPGICGNVFAINTNYAGSLGGFPHWATCLGEDHEMVRQSIAAGVPWYYSTRLCISGVKRYSEGGHADLYRTPKRRAIEEQSVHAAIHARWPNYTSAPPARYRSYWKKMLTDYCPGYEARMPKAVRQALANR